MHHSSGHFLIETRIGCLVVTVEDEKVLSLKLPAPAVLAQGKSCESLPEVVRHLQIELDEYFRGVRDKFCVEFAIRGTSFQKLVWTSLQQIPYGATVSYGELARKIGRPTASRAVGMASKCNPLPIIIPCHRVIGSNGQLVGYVGGLSLKEHLLTLEKQSCVQVVRPG
jgi:O-6-methylguanine DNA methyltransferase